MVQDKRLNAGISGEGSERVPVALFRQNTKVLYILCMHGSLQLGPLRE